MSEEGLVSVPGSVKPDQQREAICPKCSSKRVHRSHRTGLIERLCGVFGFYPYRCHECRSRFFLKNSPHLLEQAPTPSWKWPGERSRKRQRRRREILLWGGGILALLAILYYLLIVENIAGPDEETDDDQD
jgi:DNA-directed RNA polymerase subunit RPC12/RpoP